MRALLSYLLFILVFFLARTLRISIHGPEPPEGKPLIFAFHHGRQFGLIRYPRPEKVAILSSLSRDGQLQASILSKLGFFVVRGSSSKASAAGLLALVRAVRSGSSAALAIDGPRGPEGKVKKGVLFLARSSESAIVPVTCGFSKCMTLTKSWDRFRIPLPWSRLVLIRGKALNIPKKANNEHIEETGILLENELNRINAQADDMVTQSPRSLR